LRGGRDAVQRAQRGHQEQPVEAAPGGGSDADVAREFVQREEADAVDRVVGGRVPLDEAVRLDVGEPALQALAAERLLLAAGAARVGEALVGERLPGQVLGGVEAQGVVLAPEPHHVVAGLVRPVAVARNACRVRSRSRRRRARAAVGARGEERDDPEVGAVLAALDAPQRGGGDGSAGRGVAAGRRERQGAADLGAAVAGTYSSAWRRRPARSGAGGGSRPGRRSRRRACGRGAWHRPASSSRSSR
jgi:hypothetical protein